MSKTKGINKVNNLLWNILIILCITSLAGAATAQSTTPSGSGSSVQTNTQPTNIVVDLAQTSLDSNLGRGESGVLTLVIKNSGGMPAENVQVYLPSTGSVHLDSKQTIGTMDSGESKSVQAIVRIDNSASTGLVIIPAQISFDGYRPDGSRNNNLVANWQIPIKVYSNPSFQIAPAKTDYYKDTTDVLILDGVVKEGVKDMQTKLSSNCLTVIGSSQQYIGDVADGKGFKVKYNVKPTASGACTLILNLAYTDQSGTKSSIDSSFGVNIEDAGVDFKLSDISYNPTGPGATVNVSLTLLNIGGADAQDTTVSLAASDPFAPVDSLEKYVGDVQGGKEATVMFPLSVSFGAATQTYTIPVTITYKVGGATYTSQKTIGINVQGTVILSVINVDSSSGTPRIDIANLGSRDASSIKATLIVPNSAGNGTGFAGGRQGGQNRSAGAATGRQGDQGFNGTRQGGFNMGTDPANGQSYVVYKSDIKAGKNSVFAFTSASGTGVATLVLEYSGPNNQRVTQREMITLNGRSSASTSGRTGTPGRGGGTDYTTMGLYALAAVIIIFAGYKLYKRRKKKK
jgi:hypothetical protein